MAEPKAELWNAKNAARAAELLKSDYFPEDLEAYLIDRMAQDMPIIPGGNIAARAVATYTPTLTQSGEVTKTVNVARYVRSGNIVQLWVSLTITGSGTGNNSITVSLPATASSLVTGMHVGTGYVHDNGTAVYPAGWYLATTTTLAARRTDTGGISDIGVDPNFALANTDALQLAVTYEVAS